MVLNLKHYRCCLLNSLSYLAAPGFLSRVGWQVKDSGHVIVAINNNMNFVGSIVGHVIDHRFFMGPNGNYSTGTYRDFLTAKYVFHLGKPEETPFESDFGVSLENMDAIQTQIAAMKEHLYFNVLDGPKTMFWFTWNMFLRWVSPFTEKH
jgi:hypothetical protein